MDTWDEFRASLEAQISQGPAARAYAKAESIEDIQVTTGQLLAVHAISIARAFPVPIRGTLWIKALWIFSKKNWLRFQHINGHAFCMGALVDLCHVRESLKGIGRWPETSKMVDQAFILACCQYSYLGKHSPVEKEFLQDIATEHLIDFQDSPERTTDEQIERLINFFGSMNMKADLRVLLRETVQTPTYLEPYFLAKHYDRILGVRKAG